MSSSSSSSSRLAVGTALKTFFSRCQQHNDGWSRALKAVTGVLGASGGQRLRDVPIAPLVETLLLQERWKEALGVFSALASQHQHHNSSSAASSLDPEQHSQVFIDTFHAALLHWENAHQMRQDATKSAQEGDDAEGEATLADAVQKQQNENDDDASRSVAQATTSAPPLSVEQWSGALALIRDMQASLNEQLQEENENQADTDVQQHQQQQLEEIEARVAGLFAAPAETSVADQQNDSLQADDDDDNDEIDGEDGSASAPLPSSVTEEEGGDDDSSAPSSSPLQRHIVMNSSNNDSNNPNRSNNSNSNSGRMYTHVERINQLKDLWTRAEWDTLNFTWTTRRAVSSSEHPESFDSDSSSGDPQKHGHQLPARSSQLEATLRRLRATWDEVLASMVAARQAHLVAESPDVLAVLLRVLSSSNNNSNKNNNNRSTAPSGSINNNAQGIVVLSTVTAGFRMLLQSPILAGRTLEPAVRSLLEAGRIDAAITCLDNAFSAVFKNDFHHHQHHHHDQRHKMAEERSIAFDETLFRPLRRVCDAIVAAPLSELKRAMAMGSVALLVELLHRTSVSVSNLPLSYSPLVPLALRHRLMRVFLSLHGGRGGSGAQQQQSSSSSFGGGSNSSGGTITLDWDETVRALAEATDSAADNDSGRSSRSMKAVLRTLQWFVEFTPLEDSGLGSLLATSSGGGAAAGNRGGAADVVAAAASAAQLTDSVRLLSCGLELGAVIADSCINELGREPEFYRRLWCFVTLHLLQVDNRGMPVKSSSSSAASSLSSRAAVGIANGFLKVFSAAVASSSSAQRTPDFLALLPLRNILAHCSDDVLLTALRSNNNTNNYEASATSAVSSSCSAAVIDFVEWSTICELQRNRPTVMHHPAVVAAMRGRAAPSGISVGDDRTSSSSSFSLSRARNDDAVCWRLALAAASSQLHISSAALVAAANDKTLNQPHQLDSGQQQNRQPHVIYKRDEQEMELERMMLRRLCAPDAVLTPQLVNDFVQAVPVLMGSDRVLLAATKGVKLLQESPTGALAAFYAVRAMLATRSISFTSCVSVGNALQRCAEQHGGREDIALAFLRCRRGNLAPDSLDIDFGSDVVNRLLNSANLTVARMQLPYRFAQVCVFAMARAQIFVSGWCTPVTTCLNSRGFQQRQRSNGSGAGQRRRSQQQQRQGELTVRQRLEGLRRVATSSTSSTSSSSSSFSSSSSSSSSPQELSQKLHGMWQEYRREMFPVWMLEPVPVLGSRSAVPAPAFMEMFRQFQRSHDTTYCIELVAEVSFILREAFIANSVVGIFSNVPSAVSPSSSSSDTSSSGSRSLAMGSSLAASSSSFFDDSTASAGMVSHLVRSAVSVVLSTEDAGALALMVLILFPTWRGSQESIAGEEAMRREAAQQRITHRGRLSGHAQSSSPSASSGAKTTTKTNVTKTDDDEIPKESSSSDKKSRDDDGFEAFSSDVLAESSSYRNQFLLPLVQVVAATLCRTLHVQTLSGTIGTQRADLLRRAAHRLLPFAKMVASPYAGMLERTMMPMNSDRKEETANHDDSGVELFCKGLRPAASECSSSGNRNRRHDSTAASLCLPEAAISEIVPLMSLEGHNHTSNNNRNTNNIGASNFHQQQQLAALKKLEFVVRTPIIALQQHVFLTVLASLFVQLNCYSATVPSAAPSASPLAFSILQPHMEHFLSWAECIDRVIPTTSNNTNDNIDTVGDQDGKGDLAAASVLDHLNVASSSSNNNSGAVSRVAAVASIMPAIRLTLLLLRSVSQQLLDDVPAMTMQAATMKRRVAELEKALLRKVKAARASACSSPSSPSGSASAPSHISSIATRAADRPHKEILKLQQVVLRGSDGNDTSDELLSSDEYQRQLLADAGSVSDVVDRWSVLPPQALVAIVRSQFVLLRQKPPQSLKELPSRDELREFSSIIQRFSDHTTAPFFPANSLVFIACLPWRSKSSRDSASDASSSSSSSCSLAAGSFLSHPEIFALLKQLPPPPRLAWVTFQRIWSFRHQLPPPFTNGSSQSQRQRTVPSCSSSSSSVSATEAFSIVSAGGPAVWQRTLELLNHSPIRSAADDTAQRHLLLELNSRHRAPFIAAAHIAATVYFSAAGAGASATESPDDVVAALRVVQSSRRCFPPLVSSRLDEALKNTVVKITSSTTTGAAPRASVELSSSSSSSSSGALLPPPPPVLRAWAAFESRAAFESELVASNRDLARRLDADAAKRAGGGAQASSAASLSATAPTTTSSGGGKSIELPQGCLSLDLCSADPVSFVQSHIAATAPGIEGNTESSSARSFGNIEVERTSNPAKHRALVESWVTVLEESNSSGNRNSSKHKSKNAVFAAVPYKSLRKNQSRDVEPIIAFIDNAPTAQLLAHMHFIVQAVSNRLADRGYKDVVRIQTALWKRRKQIAAGDDHDDNNKSNRVAMLTALHLAPPRMAIAAAVAACCLAREILTETAQLVRVDVLQVLHGGAAGEATTATSSSNIRSSITSPTQLFAELPANDSLVRSWRRLGEWCGTVLQDLVVHSFPLWRTGTHTSASDSGALAALPPSPAMCAALIQIAAVVDTMMAASAHETRSRLLRFVASELSRLPLSATTRIGGLLVSSAVWTRLLRSVRDHQLNMHDQLVQQQQQQGRQQSSTEQRRVALLLSDDAYHIVAIVGACGANGAWNADYLRSAVVDFVAPIMAAAIMRASKVEDALRLVRLSHKLGSDVQHQLLRNHLAGPLVRRIALHQLQLRQEKKMSTGSRCSSSSLLDLRPLLFPPACAVPAWVAALTVAQHYQQHASDLSASSSNAASAAATLAICVAVSRTIHAASSNNNNNNGIVSPAAAAAAAAHERTDAVADVCLINATWHVHLSLLAAWIKSHQQALQQLEQAQPDDATSSFLRQRSLLTENSLWSLSRVPDLSPGQLQALIQVVEAAADHHASVSSPSSSPAPTLPSSLVVHGGVPRNVSQALTRIVNSACAPRWDSVLALLSKVSSAYGGSNAPASQQQDVQRVISGRVAELIKFNCPQPASSGSGAAMVVHRSIDGNAITAIVDATSRFMRLDANRGVADALQRFIASFVPGLEWRAVEPGVQGHASLREIIVRERPQALHRALQSCRRHIAAGELGPVIRMAKEQPTIVGPFAHEVVQQLRWQGAFDEAARVYASLVERLRVDAQFAAATTTATSCYPLLHPDVHAEYLISHQRSTRDGKKAPHGFDALIRLLDAQTATVSPTNTASPSSSSPATTIFTLSPHFRLLCRGAVSSDAGTSGGEASSTEQLARAVNALLHFSDPTDLQRRRLVATGFLSNMSLTGIGALSPEQQQSRMRVFLGLARCVLGVAPTEVATLLARAVMQIEQQMASSFSVGGGSSSHTHQQRSRTNINNSNNNNNMPLATSGALLGIRKSLSNLLATATQMQSLEQRFPTTSSVQDSAEIVLQECTATDNWSGALLFMQLWMKRHAAEQQQLLKASSSSTVAAPTFPESVTRRVLRLLVPGRSVTAILFYCALRNLPHAESWNRSSTVRLLLLYALVRALRTPHPLTQKMLYRERLTVRSFAEDCVAAGVPVSTELCSAFVGAALETGLHGTAAASGGHPSSSNQTAHSFSWWSDALAMLAIQPSVQAAATLLRPFADTFSVATTTTGAVSAKQQQQQSQQPPCATATWFLGLRAVSHALSQQRQRQQQDGESSNSSSVSDLSLIAAPVLQLLRHDILAVEAFCCWYRSQAVDSGSSSSSSSSSSGKAIPLSLPSDAISVLQVTCVEHFGANWESRMHALLNSAGVLPGGVSPASTISGGNSTSNTDNNNGNNNNSNSSGLSENFQYMLEAQLGPRLTALKDGMSGATVAGAWRKALDMCNEAREGGVRLHLATYRSLLDVLLVRSSNNTNSSNNANRRRDGSNNNIKATLYPDSLREVRTSSANSLSKKKQDDGDDQQKRGEKEKEGNDEMEQLPSAMALLGAMRDDGVHVANAHDLSHLGGIALFRLKRVCQLAQEEEVEHRQKAARGELTPDDADFMTELRREQAFLAADCATFFDYVSALANRRYSLSSLSSPADQQKQQSGGEGENPALAPLPPVNEALARCVIDFVQLLSRSLFNNQNNIATDVVDEEMLRSMRPWSPVKWVNLLQHPMLLSTLGATHCNSQQQQQQQIRAEFVQALAMIAQALRQQHDATQQLQNQQQRLNNGNNNNNNSSSVAITTKSVSASALVALINVFNDAAVRAVHVLFECASSSTSSSAYNSSSGSSSNNMLLSLPVPCAEIVVRNECRRGAWENAIRVLQQCSSVHNGAEQDALLDTKTGSGAIINGQATIAGLLMEACELAAIQSKITIVSRLQQQHQQQQNLVQPVSKRKEELALLAAETLSRYTAVSAQLASPTTQTFAAIIRQACAGGKRWKEALRMCTEVDAESAHPLIYLCALEALEPAKWRKALHLTSFLINKQAQLARKQSLSEEEEEEDDIDGNSDDADGQDVDSSADDLMNVADAALLQTQEKSASSLVASSSSSLSSHKDNQSSVMPMQKCNELGWIDGAFLAELIVKHLPHAETRIAGPNSAWLNALYLLKMFERSNVVSLPTVAATLHLAATNSDEAARQAAIQVLLLEWSKRRNRPWKWNF